jgi:hypothetical protein
MQSPTQHSDDEKIMYKKSEVIAIALLSFMTATQQASHAGYGNLFSGANNRNGNSEHSPTSKSDSNGNAVESAPVKDYTTVCVPMPLRYGNDENNAKATIARGEKMMKSRNLKTQKKGAIIKRIGEKDLARLRDLPTQHSSEEKTGARTDSQ